jgi:bacillithiol system protein YtxJ
MNWTSLESAEQINAIKSQEGYSVIFKHSTRCSISMMVKKRFELDWDKLPGDLPLYFVDLIKHRDLSNQIAADFFVHGECVLDLSHGEVSVEEAMSVMV